MGKKKKPLWAKILIWLFSLILTIVFAIVGFCLYLYFAKGINVINVIKDVKILNQNVNINELATNQWTDEDLASAKAKFNNINTSGAVVKFTDAELAAYINDVVQKQEDLNSNVESREINLLNYGFELIQLDFDVPEDTTEVWTNFNMIFKVDLTKVKQEQFGKFPLSLIKGSVPNTLYICSNLEIDKERGDNYSTKSISMTINNLTEDQTKEIIDTLNFVMNLGEVDKFNKSVGDCFIDVLLGENGIYDQLKSQGATGYNFEMIEGSGYFDIYMIDITESKTIHYNLPEDSTNTNPTTYTIVDNIITLHDPILNGYNFLGWYTEPDGEGEKVETIDSSNMVDVTIYPKFEMVTYTISYDLNGGSVASSNKTTYTIETDTFTLTNPTKDGYEFAGWMGTGLSENTMTVKVTKGSFGNRTYTANYQPISYEISYELNGGSVSSANKTSYTSLTDTFTLTNPTKNGYEFIGWTGADLTENTMTVRVEKGSFGTREYVAHYQPIVYTITYDLQDGTVDGTNPTTYTIESEDITLINPTKFISEYPCPFVGWTGTGITSVNSHVVIAQGSTGNRSYTARYEGEEKTVTLKVGNNTFDTFKLTVGEILTEETLNEKLEASTKKLNGYTTDSWYIDPLLTQPYNFSNEISENISLYGDWTYVVNNITFYDYISKFNAVVNSLDEEKTLTIASHSELVAYIDYVRFYDITEQVKLILSYISTSGSTDTVLGNIEQEIASAYDEVIVNRHFETDSSVSKGRGKTAGVYYGIFCISNSNWTNHASEVIDQEKNYIKTQQDYALKLSEVNTRASNYNDFAINKYNKQISVTTSEQLVWVLENGYTPYCVPGSSAEEMYNAIKVILRKICDDSMTSIEKLRRIYEWIVLNVEYDNAALAYHDQLVNEGKEAAVISQTLKKYDSWYIEGVINNRKAVCEGFAKTLLVMARLENIPAIYVTGNGHAWNRVMIDGHWYGVDATHGSPSVNDFEVLSYSQFMFTDAVKSLRGYTADNYDDYSAETIYNIYEKMEFNDGAFDLYIGSENELESLLNYTKSYTINLENATRFTVDIAISKEDKTNLLSWFNTAVSHAGLGSRVSYQPISFNNRASQENPGATEEIVDVNYLYYYYTIVINQ